MNVCFVENQLIRCTVVGTGAQFQLQMAVPLAGGPIASIQRNGKLEGRPIGASGPFETFTKSGGYVYVYPDGPNSPTGGYAFVALS